MAKKKTTKKTTQKAAKTTKSTKPTKKSVKSKKSTVKVSKKSENLSQGFRKQLKLEDSYISLLLGASVVIIVAILALVLLSQSGTKTSVVAPSPVVEKVSPVPTPTVYVLQDGKSIWDVAVKFYGDGYKWTIISDANHLADNPDSVVPGMTLIIPNVK